MLPATHVLVLSCAIIVLLLLLDHLDIIVIVLPIVVICDLFYDCLLQIQFGYMTVDWNDDQ